MVQHEVIDDYFEWLYGLLGREGRPKGLSYRRMIVQLHRTPFRYSIDRDAPRAEDGKELRYRYAIKHGYEDAVDLVVSYLSGPCSVLEMMIALAIRCEEEYMSDVLMGDRTGQWFWNMAVNMGLGGMTDDRYDPTYIENVINRFLDREYSPDGKGGLFRIRNCEFDLRTVEIWYQLCWYMNNIN